MATTNTTRRAFLAGAGAFLISPNSARGAGRLRSISALGDSISDTVFFPAAFPRELPAYFPGVRVFSLGESGDTSAAVLHRCRSRGIVDYTAIAHYYKLPLHPRAPGQYCSVLAGTNDLAYLENSAHQIIANLHAIHRYLRRRGSTPFPMTIPPWAGSGFFRPEREVVRLAVNRWILTQALALNLEPLLGDGAVPPALKAAYSDGDGIHPSGEGPKVIARALARAMRRHARAMQLHVLT